MTSLRALECLVAVADHQSITQAAIVLHLSQPAVSHQIAALERQVGTPLIHRHTRGVTLTPAGRSAVSHARRAVDAAQSAVRSARATGQGEAGSLRIGCAQSLISLLVPVMRGWHRRSAGVVLSVRESANAEELLGWVESDDVDVALMPEPASSRLNHCAVADEEIVLVTAADHRLARQSVVHLSDLEGVRLIHFAPENGLSTWLDLALAEAGVQVVPVMRTAVTVAAPQLAAAGLGVAVCPVTAVSAGYIGAVRAFSPRWRRTLAAVTSAEPDPLLARFIADVRTAGVRVPRAIRIQLDEGGIA